MYGLINELEKERQLYLQEIHDEDTTEKRKEYLWKIVEDIDKRIIELESEQAIALTILLVIIVIFAIISIITKVMW